MNILKFSRQKNGMYKIYLDDNSNIIIHEDLILKYNLLLTKKIENDLLITIQKENNDYISYNLAIKYLSNKMRCTFEIKEYLRKKEVSEDTIDIVIKKLTKQGYLNDDNYSKALINDKINLTNYGPLKIIKILKENKIDTEIINSNICIFTKELEYERVDKLIKKFVSINHSKSKYILKQKILNNLIELGYKKEIILDLLNNVDFDDSVIYKKEYDKLYNKLSKKYEGKELEFKINQKLYQKGFNIKDN